MLKRYVHICPAFVYTYCTVRVYVFIWHSNQTNTFIFSFCVWPSAFSIFCCFSYTASAAVEAALAVKAALADAAAAAEAAATVTAAAAVAASDAAAAQTAAAIEK